MGRPIKKMSEQELKIMLEKWIDSQKTDPFPLAAILFTIFTIGLFVVLLITAINFMPNL